jgi:hypothetical protein
MPPPRLHVNEAWKPTGTAAGYWGRPSHAGRGAPSPSAAAVAEALERNMRGKRADGSGVHHARGRPDPELEFRLQNLAAGGAGRRAGPDADP